MIKQEIRLTTKTHGIPPVVHMVQNDTGRFLTMYPEDMTVEQGMNAVVSVHRPDNSYYDIAASTSPELGNFEAEMTQALTQPGNAECQLKVSYGGELVSTYTFIVMVQESTNGISSEQLGYDVSDLIEAAERIHPQRLVISDDGASNVTISLEEVE